MNSTKLVILVKDCIPTQDGTQDWINGHIDMAFGRLILSRLFSFRKPAPDRMLALLSSVVLHAPPHTPPGEHAKREFKHEIQRFDRAIQRATGLVLHPAAKRTFDCSLNSSGKRYQWELIHLVSPLELVARQAANDLFHLQHHEDSGQLRNR